LFYFILFLIPIFLLPHPKLHRFTEIQVLTILEWTVDRCSDRCRKGYRFFEIITPYTDGHINGSYYQELNGADTQNVIYQATASAPLDVIPPVAMCRNVTVHLDNTGNSNTAAALVNNGSADICGIQSISLNPTNFTCANVGANTVTLTVTDISNNSSTCTATVTVTDGVLPVAICQNVTVNLDNSGNGVITESGVNNGSSDACGIQSFVLDQTTFTCADMTANPHTVTLTVTEVNGNVNNSKPGSSNDDHPAARSVFES
jgi:hypothetical protein